MYRVSISKIILCCILIIINGCGLASSSGPLPESDHPYLNDFDHTWIKKEPGAPQIRLHFENLKLAKDEGFFPLAVDKLILLDKYDNELVTYGGYSESYFGFEKQDFWTDWYAGDTLKVKLVTDSSGTDYGFKIDKIENRTGASTSTNSLPESDHPYASNFKYTWPAIISEPGTARMQIHFENLDLSDKDELVIYDKYGKVIETYSGLLGRGYEKKDFSTKFFPGDTLKVELITNGEGASYGFKIDKIETRLDETNSNSEVDINSSETTNSIEVPEPSTGEKYSFDTTSSKIYNIINNNYEVIHISNENGKISIFDVQLFGIPKPILEHPIASLISGITAIIGSIAFIIAKLGE
ncbi:MAG: hypothetical protein ACYDEF_15795 [Methanosarcina sp.]